MAPKGKDRSVLTKPTIMERSIKDHHDIDINIDVMFEKDDKMVIEQVEHYAILDEKVHILHKVSDLTNHPHLQYVLVIPNKHLDSWDYYY